MTRKQYALSGLGLILVLTVAAVIAGVPGRIQDEFSDGCGQFNSTRHRKGHRPRPVPVGLHRRACAFAARRATPQFHQPGFGFTLSEADEVQLPYVVDSNSPAFWQDGRLRLFNSAWEETYQSSGDTPDTLTDPVKVDLPHLERPGTVWIESVWFDQDTGLLYGWYHFEPADLDCLTAPVIGAAISYDLGLTWEDQGPVINPAYGIDCDYDNGYFTGGNGDFSVVLDHDRKYFYFIFTSYAGPASEQGIGIARSAIDDRGQPGTLRKLYKGEWSQPALGGLFTSLFATPTGWKGPFVDSYWGPSVHWNTYLQGYVALMNHTQGQGWEQEGVYITFSKDLLRWSEPKKLLDANDWYPQVLGLGPDESDSVAGKSARVYVGGISTFIIDFEQTSAEAAPGD